LANTHLTCAGVEIDQPRALCYLEQAANMGDVESQLAAGIAYEFGKQQDNTVTVPADLSMAVKYYSLAADPVKGNHKVAQFNLGLCCFHGRGMDSVDEESAVYYYSLAARQGNADACYNLGICYLNGCGVKKNKASGLHWLGKATDSD
jgi:TPR repeat protein